MEGGLNFIDMWGTMGTPAKAIAIVLFFMSMWSIGVAVERTQSKEASGQSTCQYFAKARSQQEKMALRTSPKLKPIVDRLEAEKASKGAKVDTEALLASLG